MERCLGFWDKVCGPYVVTLLYLIPLVEWCMVGFVVKNGHQKDMFYNEIGVCEQNIDTILHSLVNITIGRVYVITLKRKRKGHQGFGMVGFKAV